jgi:MYXO-CTERM domain-containing protein
MDHKQPVYRRIVAAGWVTALLLAPATASAHFYIDYPDASLYPGPSPTPWWYQDSLGLPQKVGPCGNEDVATDSGGGPTYAVTDFAAGQTVTLQWTEVISHAGWFRIALAANRSDFVDPPILVNSSGNSADAGIEDPPVLPVLADGIYKHAIGSAKTWPPYTITLPNMECTKCTIQIIQIMLDHPSNLGNLPDGAPNPDGFLYHHCIDISIHAPEGGISEGGGPSDTGTTTQDAGSPGGNDGGGGGSGGANGSGNDASPPDITLPKSSSCGCSFAGAPSAACGALSLFGLVAVVRRRRRAR